MRETEERHPAAETRTVPRPYYTDGGLNVETYDARTAGFPGEIEWWVRYAIASSGPVLELACGTGRITWPIARAGVRVVGLDLGSGMLRVAESKRPRESREVSERVRFIRGDMTDFAIEGEFADFTGAPPAYGREQIWVATTRS